MDFNILEIKNDANQKSNFQNVFIGFNVNHLYFQSILDCRINCVIVSMFLYDL